MEFYLCGKNERSFALLGFVIFILLIIIISMSGVSPLPHAIMDSSLYIVAMVGVFLAFHSVKELSIGNFAGKSLFYLGTSSSLALLNAILINFGIYLEISPETLLRINEILWLIRTLLMVLGVSLLLTTYKLTFPRYLYLKSFSVFLIILFLISFFSGWPQILNALLITTGIMALVISGKRTHAGIVYLSTGLILVAISNIFFIYKNWTGIPYLGEMSDVALLISWVIIVMGIYCTKKHHG